MTLVPYAFRFTHKRGSNSVPRLQVGHAAKLPEGAITEHDGDRMYVYSSNGMTVWEVLQAKLPPEVVELIPTSGVEFENLLSIAIEKDKESVWNRCPACTYPCLSVLHIQSATIYSKPEEDPRSFTYEDDDLLEEFIGVRCVRNCGWEYLNDKNEDQITFNKLDLHMMKIHWDYEINNR